MRKRTALIVALLAFVDTGCSRDDTTSSDDPLPSFEVGSGRRFPDQAFVIGDEVIETSPGQSAAGAPPASNPDRNAYFGDLHVHTTYSFDAFAFGTTATPYDAYRYAKGEAIRHPGGFDVQLREPLDFYAVTDHAMFLGLAPEAGDTASELSKHPASATLRDLNNPDNMGIGSIGRRMKSFATFIPGVLAGLGDGTIDSEMATRVTKSAWRDIVDAAEQYNAPGEFTTFAAYEYTSSSDDRGNLHRNVVFKDSARLPAVPFSRFHSQNPEGLWDWMDKLRDQGIESLAIPHNSNGSNGQMFKLVDWAGNPLDDEYSIQRLRNEPLVEITQVKGTSDTHPTLSDNDEWAEFEIMPYRVATSEPSEPSGSYVRDALRKGLSLEESGITNPFRFGLIGSSDTHTGAISDDESDFFCKIGLLDSTPTLRGSVPLSTMEWFGLRVAETFGLTQTGLTEEIDGEEFASAGGLPTFGASGLAGVWAENNTRASIYEALRRKETFATSGPRIRVRFFSGFDFGDQPLDQPTAVADAYRDGVTMGGDLIGQSERTPRFLAWATRDPKSAALQRLQIIKGWEANGETFEKVYDVACSEGARVDPTTHRCPDNGARVNVHDCSISPEVGSAQLQAHWSDPDFESGQRAFYYVRALENPTCRWSTWDAVRAGTAPRSDLPKTLQERAWSSPIWYVPEPAAPDNGDAPPAGDATG